MSSQGETVSIARPGAGDDLKADFTYGELLEEIAGIVGLDEVAEDDGHAVTAADLAKFGRISENAAAERLRKSAERGELVVIPRLRRVYPDGKVRIVKAYRKASHVP